MLVTVFIKKEQRYSGLRVFGRFSHSFQIPAAVPAFGSAYVLLNPRKCAPVYKPFVKSSDPGTNAPLKVRCINLGLGHIKSPLGSRILEGRISID